MRPVTVPVGPSPEDAELDARILAAQKSAIAEQAWIRWQASLPEKFRYATTDHPKVEDRLQRIRYGASGTAGLVILGDVGWGKSWVAVSYANQAIKEGLINAGEVLFGTEAELLAAAANSPYNEVEPALRRLTRGHYKMIVLDDVGRGAWLREDMRPRVFSMVFDALWRDNGIVVVTTNLSRDALEEYIGSGAMDRLRSMCGYDALYIDERDMRRITTQEQLARVPRTTKP